MVQSVQNTLSKKYQKSLFQEWDWRFLIIFLSCIVLESFIVFIMSRRPVEEYSDWEIAQIQERFASFILDEKKPKSREIVTLGEGQPLSVDTEEGGVIDREDVESGEDFKEGDDGEQEGVGRTGRRSEESRVSDRMAAAEVRRQEREAMSQTVSSKGILGLLTGTGSAVSGQTSSDLLAHSGLGSSSGQDLDDILNRVDGLETGGRSGSGIGTSGGRHLANVRGYRSNRRATIDDLVNDLESVNGESFSRKGDLKIEAPSHVIGHGSKSTYRSAEAIHSVLVGHVKAIKYCYERELKRFPTLKGKVTVRITVNPEGAVKNVEIVSSTLNNHRVERCIISRIRLWKDFKAIDSKEGDVTFRQVYAFGY